MNSQATIAAIATPPGRGGVGIVRVSGDDAHSILRTLVPEGPESFPDHTLRLSKIREPDGALIDESLAVYMPGPRSFTGEDVVEFQCHGGPIILRRVLDAALQAGARVAEPGEFTRRAFLNGRMDLTQAEAVADLVNATTESAHQLALEHLQGDLGNEIEDLVETLTEAVVLVEAAIDFSSEEHVYQIEADEVGARIDDADHRLRTLREQFDRGRRQREGIRVVILGPTNAGKSTLFNALHGTERAIVTDVAGTTRDFLEEELHLGGTAIRLTDTAGLRDTDDRVESLGIERSRQLGEDADLVMWVVDQQAGLNDDDRRQLRQLADADDRPTVVITNKVDLDDGLTGDDRELLARFDDHFQTCLTSDPPRGVDALADRLAELAAELTAGEGVLLSRARHLEGVVDAIDFLERARQGLEMKMEHELIAIDLRDALDALGKITGRVDTDDILERIFSEFCVGK